MGTQITVKDVDGKTFQELKAAAARAKLTVGRALTMAIHLWLSETERPKKRLSDFKPIKGGPGTERLSEQIDEILYG